MCNLYRMTASGDAIAQLFPPLDTGGSNLAPLHEIFPDASAPVVVVAGSGGGRRLVTMRWGWPPFGTIRRPITNVRNLASPLWRSAVADPAQRCLVPVSAFVEWSAAADPATGRKRRHWFALPASPLFAFAGVWRPAADGARFAFLTCEANAVVGRVHPKAMPVIIDGAEDAQRWLTADVEDACALQRPFAEHAMVELEEESGGPYQPALL